MARNLSGSLVSFASNSGGPGLLERALDRRSGFSALRRCDRRAVPRGPWIPRPPGRLKPSARIGREQRQPTQHRLHRPSQPVIQMNRLRAGLATAVNGWPVWAPISSCWLSDDDPFATGFDQQAPIRERREQGGRRGLPLAATALMAFSVAAKLSSTKPDTAASNPGAALTGAPGNSHTPRKRTAPTSLAHHQNVDRKGFGAAFAASSFECQARHPRTFWSAC